MGTRHQLFIIARTPQGEYTCIMVIHFQYMAENMCQIVAAFFALVKAPFSAAAIKSELCALDDPRNDHADADAPCPYLKKLILEAAAGVSDGRANCFLRRNLNPMECDTWSGITVVDVTQPAVPRYCFAQIGLCPAHEHWPSPPILAPLSVKDYLECLRGEPLHDILASGDYEYSPDWQGLYNGLKNEPVLPPSIFKDWDPYDNFSTHVGKLPDTDLRVLLTQDADGNLIWDKGELEYEQKMAWVEWFDLKQARLSARSLGDQEGEPASPSQGGFNKRRKLSSVTPEEPNFIEIWRERLRRLGKSDQVVCLLDRMCKEVPGFPLPPQAALPPAVPSLADLALSAIEPRSGLLGPASVTHVSQPVAQRVFQHFQNWQDIPEALFPAFIKFFALSRPVGEGCIDLDACSLPVDQVSRILELHAGVTTLNVSSNPQINKAAVRILVKTFPSIKRLILVNSRSLELAEMDDLAGEGTFGSLEMVICTNGGGLWTLPGGLWIEPEPWG